MLPTGSPLHTSSAVGLHQGTRTLTSDHEGGYSRASSAARKDFCASNNDLHFVDLRVTALKAEERLERLFSAFWSGILVLLC